MKTKIQTAANNSLLRAVQSLMSDAIYTTFRSIYMGSGEDAALEYLRQYFSPDGWKAIWDLLAEAVVTERPHPAQNGAVKLTTETV